MATKKTAATKKKVAAKGQEQIVGDSRIQNWNTLSAVLNKLKEDECLSLIRLEQNGRRRPQMLNRLHARYTKLRSTRERLEIMQGKEIG